MTLQPLIVITGNVRVEGGDERQVKTASRRSGVLTTVQRRSITDARRAANVISTGYMRRLRELGIVRTPFGVLVEQTRLEAVQTLVQDAAVDVLRFNTTHATDDARLLNALLWEPLASSRYAAVASWLIERAAARDADVLAVLPRLTVA